METTQQFMQPVNLVNVVGLPMKSIQQVHSLFTLSALFKDGGKSKLHSWRQEIRGKDLLTDQQNAYERFKLLATTCKCKEGVTSCFAHNHTVLVIYCNLTDTIVYKSVYNKLKVLGDLNFMYSEKNHNYLVALNGAKISKLSFAHAKLNRDYYNLNK